MDTDTTTVSPTTLRAEMVAKVRKAGLLVAQAFRRSSVAISRVGGSCRPVWICGLRVASGRGGLPDATPGPGLRGVLGVCRRSSELRR